MSKEKYCIKGYVSGRVQGVCFRQATQEQAKLLGITGWVRNLSDGRVEFFACGDEETLGRFRLWLWQGPKAASVDEVEAESLAFEEIEGFEIQVL